MALETNQKIFKEEEVHDFYYGDQTWTYAWQNVRGLRDYMLDQGYWQESTWAAAAAGGVIVFKTEAGTPYHTVMIVLNDTVTRLFSGHTNDRHQYPYSYSSLCDYYVLW